jgi:hypothetical protein
MATIEPQDREEYTRAAVQAALAAASNEHDFAEWVAEVLSRAAAQLGSTEALLAGRPGSWEAGAIRHLVSGTVGYADEELAAYRREADSVDS